MIRIGCLTRRTRYGVEKDPQYGNNIVEEWRGSYDDLAQLKDQFDREGRRTQLERDTSGDSVLFVRVGGVDELGQESVTERWEVDTQTKDIDIWQCKEVTDMMEALEDSKKDILEAAENGQTAPVVAGYQDLANRIHLYIKRGVTTVPFKLPVISRFRSYGVGYSRPQIDYLNKVWTRANLISVFSIPVLIQNQMPADPDSSYLPTYTTWGWKLEVDKVFHNRTENTIEEEKSWVGDFIPTLSKTYVFSS